MVPSGHQPSAESLLAAWLARNRAGGNVPFDELLREHPDHGEQVRELHRHWQMVEAALRERSAAGEAPAHGSLAERLKERFGSGVDPQVTLSLDAEPSAAGGDTGFTTTVMSRLAGRGPAPSRYRLEGEIGRGGMGAVLCVRDEDLRRHLAMKVMIGNDVGVASGSTPPPTSIDPKLLSRFLEEAQVTGQLDHPGIVPVHELGLDAEGRVYFTMKLVKGRTLKDVFDDLSRGAGGWTQVRVLGLLMKVCEAMSYAHAKRVIHRDLKPANVMVGRYGEVYVMDWGLARVLGREDTKDVRIRPEEPLPTSEVRSNRQERAGETPDSPLYTMDGDVVGTPAYMSPEQAAGRLEELGPASDVYALGAMLYHLIAGHMPYVPPSARTTNLAIWQRVQEGPPRALHEMAPQAPAELVAICDKAMARQAAARYPDMAALAADLSAYVEGRVVKAYETGAWAETRKWVSRNKALAASISAALAVAVTGAISFAIKADEARAAAALAFREAKRADEKTADVLSLSASKDLETLLLRAGALWPAHPHRVRDFEHWIADEQSLIGGRPADVERGVQRRPSLAEYRSMLSELELRGTKLADGSFSFADSTDSWWHAQLLDLVVQLQQLRDSGSEWLADPRRQSICWAIRRRCEFARTLGERSLDGPEAKRRWAEAIAAVVASPRYGGLELAPQLGLVPIGADRNSGLWEFWHLQTGDEPPRGSAGVLQLSPESGLVFVLIPGGSYWMGAQAEAVSGRNHDPQAKPDELPVHEVKLSPFFLSKYEMTQAQWLRMSPVNPSYYDPSRVLAGHQHDLRHPVEQVSWDECVRMMGWLGLDLPSEAQWEYACRAGTSTTWWTGPERESLRGRVNIADQAAASAGFPWQDVLDWPDLDDGWAAHAPVGSLPANPFGLHELAGNVYEWCADGYHERYYSESAAADPIAPVAGAAMRVLRGGSLRNPAAYVRSSFRDYSPPENRLSYLGLRPARGVDP